MTKKTDAVVIGGGIAGVAAAYYLASTHRVTLVEAEDQLAHHATGRSAALFFENYGARQVRPLTKASRGFFTDPPAGLSEAPLVSTRGAMWIARPEQAESLAQVEAEGSAMGSDIERLTPRQAVDLVSVLVESKLGGALLEPGPLDLDVAATHQAFVRGLKEAGGSILTSTPVTSLERHGRRWTVSAGAYDLDTRLVVNAAGAWGDNVAAMAGVEPVGLMPLRRTAFMVSGDESWARWPMVVDADHAFYFKPDGSQLLCSPADETHVDPGDAQVDPLDIALAIERINRATTLGIVSVRSQWAGLRTFTSDRAMVIGPDPACPGFVWLVGQGGTGIQTAPAAGELVASLIREEPLPAVLAAAGVDVSNLAVERLR